MEDKDEDDSDPAEDHEPSPPRVKNYREAMECLEDVRSFFFELHGHASEATKAEELVNRVSSLQCSSERFIVQTKLTSSIDPRIPPKATDLTV